MVAESCTVGITLRVLGCLQFFSWLDILRSDGANDPPFEKKWGAISRIVAEVDRFAQILVSDQGAAPAVTISLGAVAGGEESPGWLRARARWNASAELGRDGTPQRDYFLFVANDGNGGGLVTFTLGDSVGDIGAGGVEVQ